MNPSKNMTPDHFQWELKDGLGIITLNRPERKNPLTFDSYAELRDTFRNFSYTDEIRAVTLMALEVIFVQEEMFMRSSVP